MANPESSSFSSPSAENILFQLTSVTEFQVGVNKRYDVYFTDKRMVVIDLGRVKQWGERLVVSLEKLLQSAAKTKNEKKDPRFR